MDSMTSLPAAPRKPKRPLYDSLIRKRCRHPQSEWELCRHDWFYHVTCGTYVTKQGKKTARKFRGPIPDARSFDEAKRAYARIAHNIRNGRAPLEGFTQPGDGRTMAQGVETWLSIPRDRKASTLRGYRNLMNAHVLPALGSRRVVEVTPDDCERFILNVKPARRTLPLSERTKQAIAVTLQAFFTFAVRQRWRPDNPARGLADTVRDPDLSPDDAVLDPSDHGKYFTAEEAALLLDTVERKFPDWHLFVRTGLQTGMRMGELAALRYEHINWRERYIHVKDNFVDGQATSPKNRKTRQVNIEKRLNALLRLRWRAHRDSTRLVFPSEAGTPIDVRHFHSRVWQRIIDATGLNYRPPKAMRHTHTTLLLMAGEPIAWVAAQAGRSIAETERTYYHFLPRHARGGAEALAKLLEGKKDDLRSRKSRTA